jgi:hypothetical protein
MAVYKASGEAYRPGAGMTTAEYKREWRRRRRANRRQICQACRLEFVPARKDARYCTPACRFRAYRGRLAAAADERARIDDLCARLIG